DDYDPGTGPLASAGGRDVFVAKYAPDHTPLWARSLGTPGDDDFTDLRVDARGDVLVLGPSVGTVLLDPSGTTQRTTQDAATGIAVDSQGRHALIGRQNGAEIWVEKRAFDGTTEWRKTYAADEVSSVSIDDAGEVAFSGRFRGTVNFGGQD